jgi:ribonuclease P protein component
MRPHGFPARLRLKQRREFLRVQRGGRKIHVRQFMVFVAPRIAVSGGGPGSGEAAPEDRRLLPTRCGITVTRKVGNAVARNRIKRLVREVFRQHRQRLPAGLDMVWVAKQQAAGVGYAEVLADFEALIVELAKPAKPRSRRSRRGRGRRGSRGGSR